MLQYRGPNKCCSPNLRPPLSQHALLQHILSDICLFCLLSVKLNRSEPFIQSFQSHRVEHYACAVRCLASVFAVSRSSVCERVSCTLLPYGGCISPQCKHSWLPPVAASANSSLLPDTKSPNRRITFSASTLIWLLGSLGFTLCCLEDTLVMMLQPDIQTISDVRLVIMKSLKDCSCYFAAGHCDLFFVLVLIVTFCKCCNLNMSLKYSNLNGKTKFSFLDFPKIEHEVV